MSEEMPGNGEQVAHIHALLNNLVLDIAETDTISARLEVSYSVGDDVYRDQVVQTIRLLDRNAVTWDDDRKVAAFVTAKDPEVLRFAKRVIGSTGGEKARGLNANLIQAMKLLEGLRASDMAYVIDPSTPYMELSKVRGAVDFLQFPRQTLEYRAGDCDDLSILYNALLESVGIPTAFITVPGHIFIAFDIRQRPSEAAKYFSRPEKLIFREGRSWLPVDTTAIEEGFLGAWDIGANLFARYESLGEAFFFTTGEAWSEYEPVGFGERVDIELPDSMRMGESFRLEFAEYRKSELKPREEALLADLAEKEGNIAIMNRLGVLYSRYGLYDRAIRQFDELLAKQEYLPAIMNKGNVHSLLGELPRALEYFLQAAAAQPDDPRILLAITAIYLETGAVDKARETYGRITVLDPELAGRFPLLGSGDGSRAADQASREDVFGIEWD